jgi:hypothetical protein
MKIKIDFAPGAFDNFEGTQEELEELIAEITKQAESGELFETAELIDSDIEEEFNGSKKPPRVLQ